MSIFTGSAVAIVTPFLLNGGVNFDAFGKLIDFQIQEGTDAIVVCGTTGEPATMTPEEKASAIEFCVKHVAGRVPVVAGTGGNNTQKTIEDSLKAEKLGADALLLVTPYYNKCTQDGLVAHFNAVGDAVTIPMIIYNVPSRTGVNILPATMQKIAEHPRVVALKDACADITQITETARLCQNIDIYSGNDDHVLPMMPLGAKGVISVVANVAPRDTHDLVASYLSGDIERSRALQFKLNPLVQALFCEVSPIPAKAACRMMGFDVGEVRLPLTPMTEGNRSRLENEMKKIGLI